MAGILREAAPSGPPSILDDDCVSARLLRRREPDQRANAPSNPTNPCPLRLPDDVREDIACEDHPLPNVLFVASSAGEGGIERLSVRLASRLVEGGVNVTFACAPNSFAERHASAVEILTEPLTVRNSADIAAIRQLAAYIDELKIDIVHIHSRRDYIPGLLAVALHRWRKRNGRKPRVIVHSHLDKPLGGLPASLTRRLFASLSDGIIGVSEAVQRRLIDKHGFASSFVRIIYNGIDMNDFHTAGTRSAIQKRMVARKDLSLPHDALVLGMVGRLDAKGQAILLRTAGPLLRRRRNLWIVLVGPEGLPGDMDRLREVAVTEGIASRTVITGSRNDVPDLITAMDILVHLPSTESFGLALVEAMAAGLPTIASDIGGCREIVAHEITGLLVPHGDSGALQAALTRLAINEDGAEVRKKMGQAGRTIAESRFTIEKQVESLRNWYIELTRPAE
ncbi:MAG: glycosyltransferase family 4 protein [Capsulimonadaceae bacterium]